LTENNEIQISSDSDEAPFETPTASIRGKKISQNDFELPNVEPVAVETPVDPVLVLGKRTV
jgi:hypothetical protein